MTSGFAFDTPPNTEAIDTLIERGVIQLLMPLVYAENDPATPEGPYLRTLESIPQRPSEEYFTRQREEYMRRTPGVLVYVGDGARSDANATAGSVAWFEREVLLVVFSGVATDVVDGRLNEQGKLPTDTRNDPGIRVIRQHVTERLNHKHLATLPNTAHTALRVDGYMELETTEAWSSWGIRASLVVEEVTCAASTRAAAPVDAIRTIHDVQEAGAVAQQKVELA